LDGNHIQDEEAKDKTQLPLGSLKETLAAESGDSSPSFSHTELSMTQSNRATEKNSS